MVRLELIASDPKLKLALAELSGRITTADMQKLDAKVSLDHKKPADVASGIFNAGRFEIIFREQTKNRFRTSK